MSRQPNKTLIGAFVIGAIVLAVMGILIFASGKLFTEKSFYVLYFDGSVNGLDVGAPVNFRGVRVGEVTDIMVRFEGEDVTDLRIPVFIEIEPGRVSTSPHVKKVYRSLEEYREELEETGAIMDQLIKSGMRAQLVPQSLVTGKLFVQLDFHEDQPINLVDVDSEYPQIPTIPSTMEEIAKAIEELPIKELVQKATNTIEGLERLINSPDLKATIENLDDAVKAFKKLAQDLNREVGPLTASIEDTFKAASTTLQKAGETLEQAKDEISAGSPVRYELSVALKEISDAARSLRLLTDYLQRHPESLIRGKGGE